MRSNILFLENHFDDSTRKFIGKKLDKFKLLGYTTVMVELPSTMTLDGVINALNVELSTIDGYIKQLGFEFAMQFLSAYNNQSTDDFKVLINVKRTNLEFYNAVKMSGFACEFVDDADLVAIDEKDPSLPNIAKRDKIMAERIIAKNKSQNGGVIIIAGCWHKTLLEFLSVGTTIPLCSVIICKTANKQLSSANASAAIRRWFSFESEVERKKYYSHEVKYFDIEQEAELETFLQGLADSSSPSKSSAQSGDLPSKAVSYQLTKHSGSPITATGDAHDALVRKLNALLEKDKKRKNLEAFEKSIHEKKYSQGLRRACNFENIQRMLPLVEILLQYKNLLEINIDEQVGDENIAAIHYAAQMAAKVGDTSMYDLLVRYEAKETLVDKSLKTPTYYLLQKKTAPGVP